MFTSPEEFTTLKSLMDTVRNNLNHLDSENNNEVATNNTYPIISYANPARSIGNEENPNITHDDDDEIMTSSSHPPPTNNLVIKLDNIGFTDNANARDSTSAGGTGSSSGRNNSESESTVSRTIVPEGTGIDNDTISSSSLSLRYSQLCTSLPSLASLFNSSNHSNNNIPSRPTNSSPHSSNPFVTNLSSTSSSSSASVSSISYTTTTTSHEDNSNNDSALASTIITTDTESSSYSQQQQQQGTNISRHELQSFLNVGHLLIQQQQQLSSSTVEASFDWNLNNDNIINECNWEKFGIIADEILSIMEPNLNLHSHSLKNPFVRHSTNSSNADITTGTDSTTSTTLIREPPLLTTKEIEQCQKYRDIFCTDKNSKSTSTKSTTTINRMNEIITSSSFPTEFQCPLCHNLLIGCIILDCGCHKSTFCITCLEKFQNGSYDDTEKDYEENDGFVMIHWNDDDSIGKKKGCHIKGICKEDEYDKKSCCPSCTKKYNNAIPCNIINVAVLNAVRTFRDGKKDDDIQLDDIEMFQSNYYVRLQEWREEFHYRCEKVLEMKKKELLNKVIAEQEALMDEFQKKKKEQNEEKCSLLHTVGEWPIFVAAVIGINFFLFRKWRV